MTMTRTMAQTNLVKKLKEASRGRALPKINFSINTVRSVPEGEVAAVQQMLLRSSADWKFNDRYRVLIVPADEEDILRENLARMKRENGEKFCLYMCDDGTGEDVIPEAIFLYNKDGTVIERPFCRQCMAVNLQEFTNGYFNPNTRMIDQTKFTGFIMPIDPIPAEPSDGHDNPWPVVPLGQLVWAFMSDRHTLAPLVKAWVSGVQEYTIRKAKHLIVFCPDHPAILMMPPPPRQSFKCPHCTHILCSECGTWHKMENPCDLAEPEGTKSCPRCKVPVIKISGCNRVTCRCGASFCWKCPADKRVAYNTPTECYAHLAAVHGGPWDT
jgi:hypothetical protein